MNFGLLGKGNASLPEPLDEQIEAGAMGLKLHEDWGTTPAAIDNCLNVAEKYDIQVAIHTDTLNESGFVEDTLPPSRAAPSTPITPKARAAVMRPTSSRRAASRTCCRRPPIPTRPYTVNTVDEHLDMLMVCHHLDPGIAEDVAFAESRIRRETIAAEDILHDLGAMSMISSDSQAMGRVGEVITRTWQTAHKMKVQRGACWTIRTAPATTTSACKRYVAKYTINPAITHGIAHEVGSIEKGKLADIVLWKPAFFGAKTGDDHQGRHDRRGAHGRSECLHPDAAARALPSHVRGAGRRAARDLRELRVEGGRDEWHGREARPAKRLVAVQNTRAIRKKDLMLNDYQPKIEVDSQTYEVRADGEAVALRAGQRCCRWRSGTSCSDGAMLQDQSQARSSPSIILARRGSQAGAAFRRALEEPAAARSLDNGEEAGLFLERGSVLRHGDLLLADDGRVVEVEAAQRDGVDGAHR